MWNVFHSSGWKGVSGCPKRDFHIIYSHKVEMAFYECEKGEKKLLIEKNVKK